MEKNSDTPGRYARILLDYWFKRSFGSERWKRLLILFLQEIIPERKIEELTFVSQEHLSPSPEKKGIRIDVECVDKDGTRFVVEMQLTQQYDFYQRAVFNSTFAIQQQMDKLEATLKANEAANAKAEPVKPTIVYDDFQKLDIRVGTVLECERVPKMKKLLKFLIDDGLEKRTIVSGIAQWYEPEQLKGKQVLFIANLAPREFKNGLVSQGMILSAENYDGTISVTTVEHEVKAGSQVS